MEREEKATVDLAIGQDCYSIISENYLMSKNMILW